MICIECIPLLNAYENYPLEFDPESMIECHVNDTEEVFDCEICESDILSQDFYILNEEDLEDLNARLAKELGEEMSKHIASCSNCGHGSSMEDMRASLHSQFKREPEDPEEIFESLNVSTTICDLLGENTLIPYEQYSLVIDSLRCSCGNGGGAYNKDTMYDDKFEEYTEIYTESDIQTFHQTFYGDPLEEVNHILRLMDHEITLEELEEFRESYISNSVYISSHSLFRKLEESLTNLWNEGYTFDLYSSKRLKRILKTEKNKQIDAERVWNPPNYVSSQGRYNTAGQSILYTAIDVDFLKREVPLDINKDEIYHYATFRVNRRLECLPVDDVFSDFIHIIKDDTDPVIYENNKRKYVFTNIIQLICKKVGYEGIVYESVKESLHINYALFNFEKEKDISLLSYY